MRSTTCPCRKLQALCHLLFHATCHLPLHLRWPRPLVCPLLSPIQVVLYVGGFTKPDLQLFSAAGLPLGRVLWDSRARVVAAGWTQAEQLLVVDDAAQVRTGT